MLFSGHSIATALVAGAAVVSAKWPSSLVEDASITWGPVIYAGTSTQEIVKFSTTTYPGAIPSNQKGIGLFLWPGLTSDGTSDLIQSVIGSYPPGQSECSGANANTEWCISSEVYSPIANNGSPEQFVGSLTTLEPSPNNGLQITYTLTDKSTYNWTQLVTDLVTRKEMATYTMKTGPMKIFEAAVECQGCTPTIADQTYINTTVTLAAAEPNWSSLVSTSGGATFSKPTTTDGGVTWVISKITFPAMT